MNYYVSAPLILTDARDYIDGLLLSDGHLDKSSTNSYFYQQCKHKEWLDRISEDLYEYGIECVVDNKVFRAYKGTQSFIPKEGLYTNTLRSYRYIEFKEMINKWYQKSYDIDKYPKSRWHEDEDKEYYIWKKTVPKDICLSSICVANWFNGDGGAYKQTYRKGYYIEFSTNDFMKQDTEFLADLLSEVLDIRCTVNGRNMIDIYRKVDVTTVLNYINLYIPDCYSRKIPNKIPEVN